MGAASASYVVVAWVVLMMAAFPSFASPRRGMLVIAFSGWLFLPEAIPAIIELGPIKLSKFNAINYAMLLAVLLYDSDRLFSLTPRMADLPMAIWACCPCVATILNDPPPDGGSVLRDVIAQTITQLTSFLIPYLIGRAYFADLEGAQELIDAFVIAGLVYVPLCLYEVRFSPQLHAKLYGYPQHEFLQQIRYDGYRPMIFMSHGLTVGLFISFATVLAAWSRESELRTSRWLDHAIWALGITLVICKSTGSIALGAVGVGLYWLGRISIIRAALLMLTVIPPAYCVGRATGMWTGNEMVDLTKSNIDSDRSESIKFRLEQENQLIAKALQQPLFGWGGWGRNLVKNEEGKDLTISDGLWIIYMGTSGIVGLTAFGAMMLLPVVRYAAFQTQSLQRIDSSNALIIGYSLIITLVCIDALLNAPYAPIYYMIAGGLTGLTSDPERALSDD